MGQLAYNPSHNPWGSTANNIGAILANSPRLKAMQREQQSRAELQAAQVATQQAQARHYDAETGKVKAQTGALDSEATDSADLEKSFGDLMGAFQTHGDATPALRQVAGKMGRYMQKHPDQSIEALRSLASSGLINQAGTNLTPAQMEQAAAMQDSNKAYATRSRADVAEAKPTVVSPGGAVLPPGYMAGRPEPFKNPSAAGANNAANLMDTVVEKYPETPAKPEVPPSTTGSLWWKKQVPGSPAVPYQPARTVTHKIPRGGSIADLANSGLATNPPAAPAIDVQSTATTMPAPATNAPAAMPPAPRAPAAPAGPDPKEILAQAQDAIARGADPGKVKERLARMGINVQ